MLVKGVGEGGGLSRMFFNTGDGVAERGDIASEALGERGEGGGLGLECEPGDPRARRGRPARAACGEQRLFAEPVTAADMSEESSYGGHPGSLRCGFEDGFDEILLAHDAGIGLAAVEDLIVAFSPAFMNEAGIAGAGHAKTGGERP